MLTEMRDTCEMIMFDIDTMDKDNNASFPNEFIFRTLFFNQTFSFNFVQMNGIVNDFSLNNIFTYNSNNIVRSKFSMHSCFCFRKFNTMNKQK